MKSLQFFFLILTMASVSSIASAQSADDVKTLIKQGQALHDEGKYTEAIDKYNEALKIDPENYQAYYEISFSLYTSGKGKQAIHYLEKTTGSNSPYKADGYDLLGSIYDDDHQPDKAIECYKEGIKANPQYQRLYFNIGITYLREKKYAEAEAYAIDAIKLDPKHASSQRVYAIAAYHQNKRGRSLLAWCSFLMLEPQTKRSPEAYNYLKAILNYGIKQTGEKSVTITMSTGDLGAGNLLMPLSITNATDGKKNLTPVDSLALQLTSLFKISHSITKDAGDPFVLNYFSNFFEKLGASDHMPAFARLMSLSAYKDENLQWFKDNESKVTRLDNWMANTKREF